MVDKILEWGIFIIITVPNCQQLEGNYDGLFGQLLHKYIFIDSIQFRGEITSARPRNVGGLWHVSVFCCRTLWCHSLLSLSGVTVTLFCHSLVSLNQHQSASSSINQHQSAFCFSKCGFIITTRVPVRANKVSDM